MRAAWRNRPRGERLAAAYARAAEICDEDVAINQAIGRHGLKIIREIAAPKAKGAPVNILTHCNAGWLATVDRRPATPPMYLAFEAGMPLHVWAPETRPRNPGASPTSWERCRPGAPHTVIAATLRTHHTTPGKCDHHGSEACRG